MGPGHQPRRIRIGPGPATLGELEKRQICSSEFFLYSSGGLEGDRRDTADSHPVQVVTREHLQVLRISIPEVVPLEVISIVRDILKPEGCFDSTVFTSAHTI